MGIISKSPEALIFQGASGILFCLTYRKRTEKFHFKIIEFHFKIIEIIEKRKISIFLSAILVKAPSSTKEVNTMGKRTASPVGRLTDEQIVELYFNRDERAIRETEAKYGRLLISIAYNILHDLSDSEECQNDTLLRVWNRIPPVRPNVFSAFISKITRDIAIDKYKERTSKKRIPSELTVSMDELDGVLHGDGSPDTMHSSDDLAKIIGDYVKGLSERQRYIFIERYYLFATFQSIANELGVGLATVHRETEKIKKGLKAHLERNGVYL